MIQPSKANRRWLRRTFAVAVLLAAAVGIGGCLKVRLGDPANSTIDPKLVGYWLAGENNKDPDAKMQLAMITPFDNHAYVIHYAEFKKTANGVDREGDIVLKAWLTDVKGAQFLTVQDLSDPMSGNVPAEPDYTMLKLLQLADGSLVASPLNDDFPAVKDAKTPEQLAAAIAGNLNDPKLFGDPGPFRKLTTDDADKTLMKQVFGN
jgi:hypothetical protein